MSESWQAWQQTMSPQLQVMLDHVIEKTYKNPDSLGYRWARVMAGEHGIPPRLLEAIPTFSWEKLIDTDGDLITAFPQLIPPETQLLPSGTFVMGSLENHQDPTYDEHPHQVTLTRPFRIGVFPVTQEQWCTFVGELNYYYRREGKNIPVTMVNYFGALRFCNALSAIIGQPPYYHVDGTPPHPIVTLNPHSQGYRLPTEAEWEYAAKAGQPYRFAGTDVYRDVAWSNSNSNSNIKSVGLKKPNAWGLYDMSGNVFEWVQDTYAPYSTEHQKDPCFFERGTYKVKRGGSYKCKPALTRVSYRGCTPPLGCDHDLGFRIALSA